MAQRRLEAVRNERPPRQWPVLLGQCVRTGARAATGGDNDGCNERHLDLSVIAGPAFWGTTQHGSSDKAAGGRAQMHRAAANSPIVQRRILRNFDAKLCMTIK